MKNLFKRISILFFIILYGGNLWGSEKMRKEIDVLIEPAYQIIEYGNPIPVKMSIKNNSKYPIEILFNYSVPEGIHFNVKGTKKAVNKPQPFYPSIELLPITIDVASTYAVTFYLNKYVKFKEPGEFDIDYRVNIKYQLKGVISSAGSLSTARTEGSIKVILKQPDEKALKNNLRLISKGIKSKDNQRRLETVEALCYLESPLSVEFIIYIIENSNNAYCKKIAIGALGRFKTTESQKAIKSMLNSEDSVIVKAALDELSRNGILINNDKIKTLLGAKNINTRYTTIKYLSQTGNSSHVPILESLLNDKNSLIVKAARDGIDKLKNK